MRGKKNTNSERIKNLCSIKQIDTRDNKKYKKDRITGNKILLNPTEERSDKFDLFDETRM